MLKIETFELARRLRLQAPYNVTLVKKCRQLGATFSHENKGWEIENTDIFKEALINICVDVFGVSPCSRKSDAFVYALRDIEIDKAPITIGGSILASARGRDSGASTGTNVSLLKGEISSGGSYKHWHSKVAKGSKFLIRDLPIGISDENFRIEYVETPSEKKDISVIEIDVNKMVKSLSHLFSYDEIMDIISNCEVR